MGNNMHVNTEHKAKEIMKSFLSAFSKKINLRIRMMQFYDQSKPKNDLLNLILYSDTCPKEVH